MTVYETMELHLQNVAIAQVAQHAQAHLDAATVEEICCGLAIPLLALLVGIRTNRYIDGRKHTTLRLKIIDFTGPLVSPVLALLLSLAALVGFKALDLPTYILPFILKLSVAWFAIQLVVLMSSRRTAGWFIALVIIPITLLHLFGIWDVTTDALEQLKFSIGSVQLNAYLILKGITAIIVLQWLAGSAVAITDNRLRNMRNMRASNRILILKIFQIALYCFVFMVGMEMVGINLTTLSVFGGALGVGLGFGLQKIASNFISGIILLFEKSIEVDDVIELAPGQLGTVRQTYARYTLIELPDGREMLVPNEEFISQRVISLTHSNKKARVEITIGVAYDSDVELARELMMEAANAHPKRLKSSGASCELINFGDSAISLQLFFWVENVVEGRRGPKSDVMLAILKAFKENGIAIPFPQREIRMLGTPETAGPKKKSKANHKHAIEPANPPKPVGRKKLVE